LAVVDGISVRHPRDITPRQQTSFDAATLGAGTRAGTFTPADVIEEALARIAARGQDGVWIALVPREQLLDQARALAKRRAAGEALPLYGLPFAVKDNIDVAGMPTTAACPAFAYTPTAHAPVVARLIAAGAIPIGKTNLDQFATGLVGVRSPYGVPRNPFDERYIVGGSSSGSGVSVGVGEVTFALGTDTAGSGRVPAALNNIVGLKPSRGLLSTTGVVPACRSLDCVSVFALTVEDAVAVADVARGYDPDDPGSRPEADRFRFQIGARPPRFRFGVPRRPALDFLGDTRAAEAFERAVARLTALGGQRVDVDFTAFQEAGSLLYDGPFVVERLEAAGRILSENPEAIIGPVRTILEGALRFDAPAAFEAIRKLARLRRRAHAALAALDALVVPTVPTIFPIAEVEASPLRRNAELGAYVNFVNLLDLAALAVPTGLRADGIPAGVTLVAPWGRDAALAGLGSALHRATSEVLGSTGRGFPDPPVAAPAPADWLSIAVVGAHLSGEPLNRELTEVGGRLVRAARTAPRYRLYALPNTTPPKPGLARVPSDGASIELEVWALPPDAFGRFVARVPAPLCIGTLDLEDGGRVSGFLCEGHALTGAPDISRFGGWRAYRKSLN
jgi:allophanate hydrolase